MELFLRGLIIGFSIAAPVGPIGVLCIRRTLAHGRAAGFVSGIGAATADAIYGSIAGLGLTVISSLLVTQRVWLGLLGGLFLVYLGVKTLLAQPAAGGLEGDRQANWDRHAPYSRRQLAVDFGSTLLLTLTNPMTILSFAAIFAGLGLANESYSPVMALWLVSGVFAGSTAWWFLLSGLASVLRQRFLKPQGLQWVNRASGIIIIGFGLLSLASVAPELWKTISAGATQQPSQVEARLQGQLPASSSSEFRRADGIYQLSFPADHGAHPDYQTEWWYYTGNLQTQDGRHFGFQLTFFRRSLLPLEQVTLRSSNWAASQVYMAHFALSDVAGESYQAFERRERGAAGLAGAQAAPFQVWLDDWRVEETAPRTYRLLVAQEQVHLDLELVDQKGPILQGDQGLSRKGPETGQASYYYSQTRLATNGVVSLSGQSFQVSGLSWMDHEFSTSVLSADQIGWDWFSIQLDDGSELMVFQIRRADGSIDPFSSGMLVAADGATTPLAGADFQLQILDTWKSPRTQAVYPARWRLSILSAGLALEITPYLADQELNVSYAYWEGCVRIQGTLNNLPVRGNGYVELTGYAGPLSGDF